jgi:alpha-ketoglutarate-dependent taurine dioxygenase
VVFFRAQDDLDNDLQKELAQRLGQLAGKPATSKLHIHPVSNSGRRLGGKDDEISVISSEQAKEIYSNRYMNFSGKKQSAKNGWHSDITFEPIPSDYALLRLTELPKTGGGRFCDTLAVHLSDSRRRHPMGFGLRTLRPALSTISKVLRIFDRDLRATRVQSRCT